MFDAKVSIHDLIYGTVTLALRHRDLTYVMSESSAIRMQSVFIGPNEVDDIADGAHRWWAFLDGEVIGVVWQRHNRQPSEEGPDDRRLRTGGGTLFDSGWISALEQMQEDLYLTPRQLLEWKTFALDHLDRNTLNTGQARGELLQLARRLHGENSAQASTGPTHDTMADDDDPDDDPDAAPLPDAWTECESPSEEPLETQDDTEFGDSDPLQDGTTHGPSSSSSKAPFRRYVRVLWHQYQVVFVDRWSVTLLTTGDASSGHMFSAELKPEGVEYMDVARSLGPWLAAPFPPRRLVASYPFTDELFDLVHWIHRCGTDAEMPRRFTGPAARSLGLLHELVRELLVDRAGNLTQADLDRCVEQVNSLLGGAKT